MSSSSHTATTTTTAIGNLKAHPSLLCAGFNQDATCIAVGHRKGYAIMNGDPFGRVFSKNDGATSIVEMLFCTSLVALVGVGDSRAGSSSTRKLQIVNTKRQSTICELTFPTSILSVKLNRRRLVVVLEEQIYIYDISNMKLLHTLETSPNPSGIVSLSPSSEACYLAYPSPLSSSSSSTAPPPGAPTSSGAGGSSSAGDVIVFDALSLSVVNIIQAHKSTLAALTLNSTGTLLATASDKGTVIRVFAVPNGDKVAQFRRGTYAARIFSIAFNPVSTLVAVTSDQETVHIFKLVQDGQSPAHRRAASGGRNTSKKGKADSVRREASRSHSGLTFEEENDDEEEASQTGSIGRYNRSGGASGGGGYDAFIEGKRTGSQGIGSLRKTSLSLGRALGGSLNSLLPAPVSGIWEPSRSFAQLKLPAAGVKSVVALSGQAPQVMVLTSEGVYYCYTIDLENGGEGVLVKSYSLLDNGSEDSGSGISAD